MKFSKIILIFFITLSIFSSINIIAQVNKGKLFIIGGGRRSDVMMSQMLKVADLQAKDFIVVLPMASEEPDSTFYFYKKQISKLTSNPMVMINFDKTTSQNKKLTDSLQKAKLIIISGGDQRRFMNIVLNTPISDAIHKAYQSGGTIAGTSAGAAVMSKQMITGTQKLSTKYSETFDNIRYDNLELTQGLGLIDNVIIDQHFLRRNRYNRLLCGLIDFPTYIGIGIDESTAIIVRDKTVDVVGESEVIVVRNPKEIKKATFGNIASIKSLEMSILMDGQSFNIQ